MGVDVSAGGSVESNPYLVNGGGTDQSASLQIDPWLKLSDDISSIDVFGNLTARQYAKSANGTDISGNLNVGGSHRFSPYFSVFGGGNYQTSRNGLTQGFANVGPNNPLPPPTTPLPDISLAGTRTRTQTISTNAGFSARLSSLDQLGGSVTVLRSSNNSPAASDFNYLNGGLTYSRTISERISATASIRYGKSNNLNTRAGDGTIITPQVGFNMEIGTMLTLSASLGVAFSRSQFGNGLIQKSKALSGDARLCRRQERGSMCLAVSRNSQPTALGNIQTLTNISFRYDTRLSSRDTVNFSLGYNSGNNDFTSVIPLRETEKLYSANGSWGHSFNRRLSAFVSPSYSRIQNSSDSYNSFRLTAGLRLSFGATS